MDVYKGVRRHHNNTGLAQIKQGKTVEQVKAMAKRIGFDKKIYEEKPKEVSPHAT